MFGHVKGGLAGGVSAPDDDHVAAVEPNCFSGRGAVMDSGADELFDAWCFQSTVVDPGGGDAGSDLDHRSAGQFYLERASLGWSRGYELRSNQNLGAQPGCLG